MTDKLEACPFCGAAPRPYDNDYQTVHHEALCYWALLKFNPQYIHITNFNTWNMRSRASVAAAATVDAETDVKHIFAVLGEDGALWATFDTREKAEGYPGPRMLELAPRQVVEYVPKRPSINAEAKAKEIVEEYKQRVVQLPSGDAIPCAKWLETRLRIAFDLQAASYSDGFDDAARVSRVLSSVASSDSSIRAVNDLCFPKPCVHCNQIDCECLEKGSEK